MAAKKTVKRAVKSQAGNQMNPADCKWVEVVNRDLESLLRNPSAGDILGNAWFEDKSMPIPSPELLEYFTVQLLWGFGKYTRFLEAAEKGAAEAVCQHLMELGKISPQARSETVRNAAVIRKFLTLIGIELNSLHWWPAIRALDVDLPKLPQIALGHRRLTRFLIEAMTLRAIFQSDVRRFEGLVDAVRAERDNTPLKSKKSEQIAFQMLLWHPYLTERIGRKPQKSEMKKFLLTAYEDILSDHDTHWSEAFKMLHLYPQDRKRKGQVDDSVLVKLGLEARGNEPKMKRIRSWKIAPKIPPREELQK